MHGHLNVKLMNECSVRWLYFAKHMSLYQCWYIPAETFVPRILTSLPFDAWNRSPQLEEEH